MTASPPDQLDASEMTCPTCNARQEWSDQCRRCKCDLSLLRSVWRMSRQSRRNCLLHLRAGRVSEAIEHARQYAALQPGEDSTRLLAVSHLLAADWPRALAAAKAT
jgi:hypothetical protein